MKLIVGIEEVQNNFDRLLVEAGITRSGAAHTFVIKRLAAILKHVLSMRMKLVKFLIIFGRLALQFFADLGRRPARLAYRANRKTDGADFRVSSAPIPFANGRQVVAQRFPDPRIGTD